MNIFLLGLIHLVFPLPFTIVCEGFRKVYPIMKILVFSDSHGHTHAMEQAVMSEQPDHILHLGDYTGDVRAIASFGIPLTQVKGNCDYSSPLPEILTPVFSGKRLYMTHGHLHRVKTMYQRAIYAALAADADILLFGHTHRAECYFDQGLWIMNPGACSARGSYGVIRLEDGNIRCCVKSVNEKRSVCNAADN